ncbi:hypothetical protein ACQ4PT_006459 [Festuca glaucescens]
MSLAADSPSPSMSSLSEDDDDFAELLAAELDLASAADSASQGDPSASPASDDEEEQDVAVEGDAVEQGSTKRRRVEEQYQDRRTAVMPDEDAIASSFKDAQVKICPPHPGFIRGLCLVCEKSQDEEDVSGVAFSYKYKGLRVSTSETLCGSEVKNLLRERKLVLILDLDHTLINSTTLHEISPADMDLGIQTAASKDVPSKSLFNLQGMHMLTKLRPFVPKLLDPGNVYFGSKVISNSYCTEPHQKGLDVVLGDKSTAVILDDTENVWQKPKET